MVKLKQQKQQIFWHFQGVERRNIGCETTSFISNLTSELWQMLEHQNYIYNAW